MSELLDRSAAASAKHEEPRSCRTEPTNQPRYLLHLDPPHRTADCVSRPNLAGSMQSAAIAFCECAIGDTLVCPGWVARGVGTGRRGNGEHGGTKGHYGTRRDTTARVGVGPRRLGAMDRVRFGRALGYGARHAAKSLVQAVDAATSPSPAGGKPGGVPGARPVTSAQPAAGAAGQGVGQGATHQSVGQSAARPAAKAQRAAQVMQAGRQASKGVLGPVKKATSVVMLQVTGSFFALLAFALGRGLWKMQGGFHAPAWSQSWLMAWVVAGLTAVLAYFCVSNFVRASRKDRS